MPQEKENNLYPFTVEQLSTTERLLPERIAEINHDIEVGERRRLDVLLEYTTEVARNVAKSTTERFAFMGSIGMYVLLNEMRQKNPQIGDLMLFVERIAGGKNDFDICVPIGKKPNVMKGFGWNLKQQELSRGAVGTGIQVVDLGERQEKIEFPWQTATLNGETVHVQNPEEMIFSKIGALVSPAMDKGGGIGKREIKWGVDIKILKTYLMVEKGLDAAQLDAYLADRYKLYTETERYDSVTQLAEQFDKTGNAGQLLSPVLENAQGRPSVDLRTDLVAFVGSGSEQLVDAVLGAKNKVDFVTTMRAIVDFRIGKPLTFEQAQREASSHYEQLFEENSESY